MTSWLNGLMSKAATGSPQSATMVIQRLQTAHSQEEKRNAVSDLKSLADDAKNIRSIGAAIPVLVNILRTDRQDATLVRPTLQTLINIMSAGRDDRIAPPESAQLANIQSFVESQENIATLLSILEEKDKIIRYFATKVLALLIINRSDHVQQVIMLRPMNPIVDLISADYEMIRNEGLLLLAELTKSNEEIKKLVAFADGFQALFKIMKSEGLNNGGVVVQDCLHVVNNMLRGSSLTMKQFKEVGCISYLSPLLALESSDVWILTDDKQAILTLALETTSLVVSQANYDAFANQTAIGKDSTLGSILKLALGSINNPGVRIKALWTLGDVIRGHTANRNFMEASKFKGEMNSTVTSLFKLATIFLLSKMPKERKAALHVFQSFLHENEEGQRAIVATLSPPPSQEDTLARMLVREMFSWESSHGDPLKSYYAALALSFVLLDNVVVKDVALRTPLEPTAEHSQTLLGKAIKSLVNAVKTQADPYISVGLLRLICTWLDNSEPAAGQFLQQSAHISFLVEVLTQSGTLVHISGLCALLAGLVMCSAAGGSATQDVVLSRTGVDRFLDKFAQLRQSDDFLSAEKNLRVDEVRKPFYDYEFTIFFKKCHDKIAAKIGKPTTAPHIRPHIVQPAPVQAVSPVVIGAGLLAQPSPVPNGHYDAGGAPAGYMSEADHGHIIKQYQGLIQASDNRYESLRKRNEELEAQVIKAKTDAATRPNAASPAALQLQLEYETLRRRHDEQELRMLTLERRVKELEAQNAQYQSRVDEAERERDDVLIYLTQVTQQNQQLQQQLGIGAEKESDIT